MTPTEKDAIALAVLDKARETAEAHAHRYMDGKVRVQNIIEARAHLAARLAAQTKMLADCFRAAGADCDGNEDWRIADRAYQAVCDLREDYNEACEELHGENGWVKRATRAEAELAAFKKGLIYMNGYRDAITDMKKYLNSKQ